MKRWLCTLALAVFIAADTACATAYLLGAHPSNVLVGVAFSLAFLALFTMTHPTDEREPLDFDPVGGNCVGQVESRTADGLGRDAVRAGRLQPCRPSRPERRRSEMSEFEPISLGATTCLHCGLDVQSHALGTGECPATEPAAAQKVSELASIYEHFRGRVPPNAACVIAEVKRLEGEVAELREMLRLAESVCRAVAEYDDNLHNTGFSPMSGIQEPLREWLAAAGRDPRNK